MLSAAEPHNIGTPLASLKQKKLMSLLDISSSGLFSHSGAVFHVLGALVKLVAGSFIILSLTVLSFIGVIIYALSKGYQSNSLTGGARTFVQGASYLIGAIVALMFVLVAGLFFTIAAFKLLFVAVLIAFTVAFVVRETFLFLVLKRFGKYVMYFTALQYIKDNVYNNGQQQQDPLENNN